MRPPVVLPKTWLKTLVAIVSHERVYKRMPAMKDLAAFLDLSLATIHVAVIRLEWRGYVEKGPPTPPGVPQYVSSTVRGRHYLVQSRAQSA